MSTNKTHLHIFYKLIATSIYTGYSPYAPGTAGSLFWLVLLWFIAPVSPFIMILMACTVFFSGVYISNLLSREWGKDPSKINIDEAAGLIIALIGLPKTYSIWIAAFFLFRIIDIFKPPPIKLLEFLPGGWGIMADDVAAGIYTNILCWIIIWIL